MNPPNFHDVTLRVRYAETDQMGIVHHSNYLVWFEVGRVELLRQLGFDYKRMEIEDDCYIAVAEVRCRYKVPARYDDEVVVRTRVRKVRESFIQFNYEVLRLPEKQLLTEGETLHLVIDGHMRRKSIPGKYRSVLSTAACDLARLGRP